MKAHQKLAQYRDRLTKWKADQLTGNLYPEPKPADFHITDRSELFMAQRIKGEVLNPATPK